MKQIPSFRKLLMSFIVLILISSCSKEPVTNSTPILTTNSSSSVTPVSSNTSNTLFVTANNWVEVSTGNYKCAFYGLTGYGNEIPVTLRVYLVDQNVETFISNAPIHFMEGELFADHDRFSLWVSFRASAEKQALPFSSLKLKIVLK